MTLQRTESAPVDSTSNSMAPSSSRIGVPHGDLLGKPSAGNGHTLDISHATVRVEREARAGGEGHGATRHLAGADLDPASVRHHGDVRAFPLCGRADAGDAVQMVREGAEGQVQSGHVHARRDHALQGLDGVGRGAYGRDDLGLAESRGCHRRTVVETVWRMRENARAPEVVAVFQASRSSDGMSCAACVDIRVGTRSRMTAIGLREENEGRPEGRPSTVGLLEALGRVLEDVAVRFLDARATVDRSQERREIARPLPGPGSCPRPEVGVGQKPAPMSAPPRCGSRGRGSSC